ncbi:MAG: hypothetical protein NC817_00125 [Candidatus Omnitrophica bacterium]|nr:hypothetical protein [Candidatus Omnitrophota bacterium]MCM8823497.1 hypothetical protein [Candidatus Omnitrophota bacterium]MCM8826643.1 hypothetical protein [Candidatus Omnitrophota bacterium]
MVEAMTGLNKEFIVSHLRARIEELNTILKNIESDDSFDNVYLQEGLKKVEVNLRKMRKNYS